MFLFKRIISPLILLVFWMFPLSTFASDPNSLREEAQKLYQTAQDYLNKSFTSNWDGIYGLQHPKFRNSVSIEEFIYFNGIIEFDYRNNGRSHVSGGYGYPTTEFIKKNPARKDILGFPVPKKYQMTTNPMVKVKKFSIEKIELTKDKKYAKSRTRYVGRMGLPARTTLKAFFDKEVVHYWEKVNGQWYISLLRDTRNISGYKEFYFIPNDGSLWESIKFISFPTSELTNGEG